MDKKIINFDNTEIQKYKLHQYSKPILIDNIVINKIVVSDEVSLGKKNFKCFIGYKNARRIRLLCIFLPKMSTHIRYFNKTKCMSFLIEDTNFLEKYDEIWEKVSNETFNCEPTDNREYLKTKIKC